MSIMTEARRSRCATSVRDGDVRSLERYLSRLNPCDYEELLPAFFRDKGGAPDWFDSSKPLGFFNKRHTDYYRLHFYVWLISNRYSKSFMDSDRSYDSALHFREPRRLRSSSWLVHFSSPDAIAEVVKNGFLGTRDHRRLVATHGKTKTERGWNFGYPVEYSGHAVHQELWGKCAVLFRSSCVFAKHMNDDDWQAIFWGPNVRRAIVLAQSSRIRAWPSTKPWDVFGSDRKIAHHAESYELAVEWAIKSAGKLWTKVAE